MPTILGVIYYLYIFGGCSSCSGNQQLGLILLESSLIYHCLSPRITSCELITLTPGVAFLINVGLAPPDSTIPSPPNVSSEFKHFSCCCTLTQSRTARLLRSILASRVLLDIRAQTGEKLIRSDGLTGLNTDHLYAGNTQSTGRLESIRFTTTKRSSL